MDRMKLRPIHPRAFTLIELLLVLVVLSAALGIAAPAISGWGRGARLRDAGDDFLATANWARAQAIATSRVHRLNLDTQAGRYWVTAQQGLEFVPLDVDFARESLAPMNVTITMTDLQSRSVETISFDPTGRTSPRIVRLADDRGQVTIICQTPAEGFRLLKPSEVIQ
ncbi:MAG TPA: GspH/FimT family pseudopilin [Tepidisphaeraceae bacterium]|nr:GspH/FimT family pseudopilin [Tepidisphaeraceae bacterium]